MSTIESLKRGLEVVREALSENLGLAVGVGWNAALLGASGVALAFDRRSILGLNPWIKPIKFEVSIIVFLLTVAVLLWALGRRGEWRRSRAWMGWGFGISMMVEIAIIALQSARGVRSHMNYATVQDALLFSVMGVFIIVNTAVAGWMLVVWCVARTGWERVVVWGVRLGLAMLLLGSAEGSRMVVHGAHTVGAADGGAGLPFVNWSRAHGDLRVAHFFALHSLQLFPLAGMALTQTQWRERLKVATLFSIVAVYSAGVWWLFAEAMRGIPLAR